MILWTIQPLEVNNLIIEKGIYRCNPELIQMKKFTEYYDWLVNQMTDRICKPPEGVTYPIWAWYIKDWKRKKLISERKDGIGDQGTKIMRVSKLG